MPYSEPQDGDEKYTVYEIDFGDIARACGWTGHLVSAGDFIIQAGALAFKKAVIAELGVAVLGVAVLIDTLETIFDELDGAYEGVTLTAVSYTHLDVYKRQRLGQPLFAEKSNQSKFCRNKSRVTRHI